MGHPASVSTQLGCEQWAESEHLYVLPPTLHRQGNAQSSPQVLSTPNTSFALAPPPRRAAAAAREKIAEKLALLDAWKSLDNTSPPSESSSEASSDEEGVSTGNSTSSDSSASDSDSDEENAATSPESSTRIFASAEAASEVLFEACLEAGGVPALEDRSRRRWTVSALTLSTPTLTKC